MLLPPPRPPKSAAEGSSDARHVFLTQDPVDCPQLPGWRLCSGGFYLDADLAIIGRANDDVAAGHGLSKKGQGRAVSLLPQKEEASRHERVLFYVISAPCAGRARQRERPRSEMQ